MYKKDNTLQEIHIITLFSNSGESQKFLILKEFVAFGLNVIAIYPCDENQVAYEDGEFEFLYKDIEGRIVISDGKLYDLFYEEYNKLIQ